MRMMLTASMPVEDGNAAIRDGRLQSTIRHTLEILKPESAYFMLGDDGERSCMMVFDMQDSSELTAVVEPFFLAFNARVSVQPVMNAEDLAKGNAGIERALREFAGA